MRNLRKIWVVLLFININLLFISKNSASDVNPFILYENFSDKGEAFNKFNLNASNWEIADGVLKTINNLSRMITFNITEEDWRDYEIEFKIKRLELNPKDQHFGIFLRQTKKSSLRLYCRGSGINFLEVVNGKEIRHSLLGKFPKPMDVGEKAKWSTFRIVCKSNEVKIYVDGIYIGAVENVIPQKGKISFYAYNLDLALDDLKVIFLDSKAKLKSPIEGEFRNIVPNSSFEYCTEPGLADYWGCPHWGLLDPYWVVHFEEWRKNFGIDDNVSFEGRRSMRIHNPFDKPNRSGLCLRSVCLKSSPNKEYTLSAYMKGKPEGMKVSFAGKEITLTENWERYTTTFINKGNIYQDMINIYPITKGTFWVDAVQLEKGKELTPYSCSLIDEVLASLTTKMSQPNIEVPQFKPEKKKCDVVLDGNLNEPCWENLKKLDFILINGDIPTESTSAYLFYNEKGIYIGVKCFDQNAEKNECKWTKRDGNVWNDPSIEIFIDPKLTKIYYYHLAFNQKGIQYDAYNNDISWNGIWEVATKTDKNFWSAEVFLPFANFGIDKTSNWWGINICRENHNKKEYSCWSPTYGGFHTPERFAHVYFDKNTLSNYYFYCEDIKFQFLSPGEYALSLNITNHSKIDGKFILRVSLKDTRGKKIYFEKQLRLPKGKEKKISLGKVKSKKGEKYLVDILLLSKDRNTTFYSASKYLSVPSLFDIKSQYNLYTREKQMFLKANFNLSQKILKDSRLVIKIRNKKGEVLLKNKFIELSSEMNIPVKIETLPYGNYDLVANLADEKGNIIASVYEKFQKLPPKPYEVKIDKISRIIIVNGKPFIPFGFSWEGEITSELLDYLAKNGFDTISFFLNRWNEKYFASILDNAYKSGLKVGICLRGREKEKVKELVEKFKDHPVILSWNIFDEIFTVKWGKENYKVVEDTCKEIKEIDPYHPVYINENQWGLSYLKGKNMDFPGDIVSIDYYAYPPSGNIPITTDYVRTMEKMGRKDGKPVWIYLFGGGYAFWASREYTPCEQEFSTYTSIINGATGILYFASHPRSKSNWEKIKKMAQEIRKLTPIIASSEKTPKVNCSAPSIQILTRRFNNKLYLITANSSKKSVNAKFNIPDLNFKRNTVKVLFENRKLNIEDNLFKDIFKGYQRHVYEIEL